MMKLTMKGVFDTEELSLYRRFKSPDEIPDNLTISNAQSWLTDSHETDDLPVYHSFDKYGHITSRSDLPIAIHLEGCTRLEVEQFPDVSTFGYFHMPKVIPGQELRIKVTKGFMGDGLIEFLYYKTGEAKEAHERFGM